MTHRVFNFELPPHVCCDVSDVFTCMENISRFHEILFHQSKLRDILKVLFLFSQKRMYVSVTV